MDWTDWSEWTALAALQPSLIPTGPGVYLIRGDRPIDRALGRDERGILDIGESDGLRTRLRKFIACATRYGEGGHMAGWRYAFLRLARHFPFETLQVCWRATSTKAEAKELEGRVMLAYLLEHCELPPLNYSFNWSPFERDRWDLLDRMIAAQCDADKS